MADEFEKIIAGVDGEQILAEVSDEIADEICDLLAREVTEALTERHLECVAEVLESGNALKVQQTGVLDQSNAASPDFFVHPQGCAPVVVETKFKRSASALEKQATQRLAHNGLLFVSHLTQI